MTNEELRQIREAVGAEFLGTAPCAEFADLVKVETGDSGSPSEIDCAHQWPMYSQEDDFEKFFQAGHDEQELQKRGVVRSRMEANRNPKPKDKPEETETCEEFFTCEKRASDSHKIRLTRRFVDGEVWIEGFDHLGECRFTKVVSAEEISEDSPLAKASITSSMLKTLIQIRAALTPQEFEAAEKAVKALDVDAFLQICRRAQVSTGG